MIDGTHSNRAYMGMLRLCRGLFLFFNIWAFCRRRGMWWWVAAGCQFFFYSKRCRNVKMNLKVQFVGKSIFESHSQESHWVGNLGRPPRQVTSVSKVKSTQSHFQYAARCLCANLVFTVVLSVPSQHSGCRIGSRICFKGLRVVLASSPSVCRFLQQSKENVQVWFICNIKLPVAADSCLFRCQPCVLSRLYPLCMDRRKSA